MMAMSMTKTTKQAHFAILEGVKLPCLTKHLRKAVAKVLSEFTDDEHTFGEVYRFLREYANRKQANFIVRYPDLVWEYCDAYFNSVRAFEYDPDNDPDPFDDDMYETVRELVKEAIRRLRNNKAWEYYYRKLRSEVRV